MYETAPTFSPRTSARDGAVNRAWLAIVGATLLVLGLYLPLVSTGGNASKLSAGGATIIITILGPAIVAVLVAFAGLSGSREAAEMAVGVVIGTFGITVYIVTTIARLVTSLNGSGFGDSHIGFGAGFWMLATASALTAICVFIPTGTTGNTAEHSRSTSPSPLCILAGLAFLGVPAALLIPDKGVSILDLHDGWIEAAIITWAIVPSLAGMIAMFRQTPTGVSRGIGITLGELGLVLGLAQQHRQSGEGFFRGFSVSHEGLLNGSVVAALVLGVLPRASLRTTQPGTRPVRQIRTPQATTRTAGSWLPDPYDRNELRYHDGRKWTDHVANGSLVERDPAKFSPPTAEPAPALPGPTGVMPQQAGPPSPQTDPAGPASAGRTPPTTSSS